MHSSSQVEVFLFSFLFQVLCSGFLHRSGQSGSDHSQHCLWKVGGHKLCCTGPPGLGSAADWGTGGSSASTNQADWAHLNGRTLSHSLSALWGFFESVAFCCICTCLLCLISIEKDRGLCPPAKNYYVWTWCLFITLYIVNLWRLKSFPDVRQSMNQRPH